MYSFVKAVCLSRSIGSQWAERDLSSILVYDIYNTYTKVFLMLSNPVLPTEVYVDMESLKLEYSSFAGTLSMLLTSIGNKALPVVESLPDTSIKRAKYSDAMRVGYKVELSSAGMNYPSGYPESELHDLAMTRPAYPTDMRTLDQYCLVSVNGYIHNTDATQDTAYVYRGADTMRKSNRNHLGITSFLDIGKLTKVKLDPDRIVAYDPDSELRHKLSFTVDEPLDDQSYLLVMGGYLVLPEDNVFWRSGENTFTLDINKLPYIERLFESANFLDLSALQLTAQSGSPETYSIVELTSEAVIKRYLTLSQSFLVIVDTPHLTWNKIHVRHSSVPGKFTCYQDPTCPLFVSYGKIAEYWKVQEGDAWSLSVQDSLLRNYIVSQQPMAQTRIVRADVVPGKPSYHNRGYFLEFTSY